MEDPWSRTTILEKSNLISVEKTTNFTTVEGIDADCTLPAGSAHFDRTALYANIVGAPLTLDLCDHSAWSRGTYSLITGFSKDGGRQTSKVKYHLMV